MLFIFPPLKKGDLRGIFSISFLPRRYVGGDQEGFICNYPICSSKALALLIYCSVYKISHSFPSLIKGDRGIFVEQGFKGFNLAFFLFSLYKREIKRDLFCRAL
jgi:hypothetical protein